ncbi:hypothetical protein ONZ45_g11404 [Pleurotus djamor]|nr:hypothetical protein ONZ45_g11404 [Pleurotus djamor]
MVQLPPPLYKLTAHFVSPLLVGKKSLRNSDVLVAYGDPDKEPSSPARKLYGITIAQTIWYFRHSSGDSLSLKSLTALLLVVDGAQTVCLAEGTRSSYLRNTGILNLSIPKGMILDLYFSSFTVILAQCALTYRVWVLSNRKRIVTSALSALTFIRFAASVGEYVGLFGYPPPQIIKSRLEYLYGLSFTEMGTSMVCDLLIAASMTFYLNKRRSGLSRTDSLVDRLIIYVVGIGVLTSVFVLIILIVWITIPIYITFMIFHSVMSKLYVNSFLVMLNSRVRNRSVLNETDTNMVYHSSNPTSASSGVESQAIQLAQI